MYFFIQLIQFFSCRLDILNSDSNSAVLHSELLSHHILSGCPNYENLPAPPAAELVIMPLNPEHSFPSWSSESDRSPQPGDSSQAKPTRPVYYCPGCNRPYSWRQSMLLHYKNACGKDPQFLCPHCPYRAKQKGNLDKHIEIKHSSRTLTIL